MSWLIFCVTIADEAFPDADDENSGTVSFLHRLEDGGTAWPPLGLRMRARHPLTRHCQKDPHHHALGVYCAIWVLVRFRVDT